MCNRYRLSVKQRELLARYGIESQFPADESYPPGTLEELFPERPACVVRVDGDGGSKTLDVMRWGFPHEAPGANGRIVKKSVTNVRNLTSPFWRSALMNPVRRCLVPFTAFSEYGSTRGPDGKLPLHWFTLPALPIASFAGVWRPLESGGVFAFLTCEPNPLVAAIHPKAMPVVLRPEDEERWLRADWEEAARFASPFPADLMAETREASVSKTPVQPELF